MTEKTGFNEIRAIVERYRGPSDTPASIKTPMKKPPNPQPMTDPRTLFQSKATPKSNLKPSMNTPVPGGRNIIEKLVDSIIGEQDVSQRYALICTSCHTHNGLALPEEFEKLCKY
jgi:hypothetical protein